MSSSAELTPTSSLSEAETVPSSIFPCSIDNQSEGDKLIREVRESRWRPAYHLQSPSGWMNDPCAPGYDSRTGLYHVSFQWNPNGPDWGDISWGSATSPDLIHWTVQENPSLSPDQSYDHKGVFTGCFIEGQDSTLNLAYTSVSQLPVHHTIPHARGSESLSIATSRDGGKTWKKADCNPVLPSEPEDLEVTGWRDPFVAKWPSMAHMLQLDQDKTLFGIISGGIRDKTPTTFLYAINANDLSSWRYLGPLANFGLNFRPSRWSGDLGKNWEVSNFLSLQDESDSNVVRDFLICGTEGCIPEPRASDSGSFGPSRPARGQLWFSGSLQKNEASSLTPVEMKYSFGGHLDHGCLYAANSFFDVKTGKQVVWGWITEEDLCDNLRHAQGWSGMLSMPRELRMTTMRHVVRAAVSELPAITSIEREADSFGSHTIRTLVSQPYQPLIESLRKGAGVRRTHLDSRTLRAGVYDISFQAADIQSNRWELDAVFNVSHDAQNIGLSIDHSGDYARATTLFFDQPSESFIINRPALLLLNSSDMINSSPELAPHTLFITRDPDSGQESKEQLHIRAWRDKSVLEVFVNGRTAISTRLYAADETFGMRFFVDELALSAGASSGSELVSATLWDGIGVQ